VLGEEVKFLPSLLVNIYNYVGIHVWHKTYYTTIKKQGANKEKIAGAWLKISIAKKV